MKRRWLLWVWLFLLVEGSHCLMVVCRPHFDVPGNINRSQPVLIRSKTNYGMLLVQKGTEFQFFGDEATVRKLDAVLERSRLPAEARRTRAGQLLDNHGRVLLDNIDERSVFAYSPKHDLLVWGTPPGAIPYGLHVRHNGKEKLIDTWSISGVQIRPDGTIWLAEYFLQCGIAVLNAEGEFQGWRAFGYHENYTEDFSEVTPADLPLVKRLAEKAIKL